jgi:hypothetical protein
MVRNPLKASATEAANRGRNASSFTSMLASMAARKEARAPRSPAWIIQGMNQA